MQMLFWFLGAKTPFFHADRLLCEKMAIFLYIVKFSVDILYA